MLTIDSLKAFGANTDEGVARCFGKEDFYLRLAKMVVAQNQADFDKLSAAIGANDLGAAFDAAHSLKGVLGNLSLTPIYDPVSEITEELVRAGTIPYFNRNYVAPRLTELKEIGILETCGRRKATRSDATEAVWRRV